MGYFGYSFFNENQDQLKALEIDDGSGCVAPSVETVQDGSCCRSKASVRLPVRGRSGAPGV